MSAAFSVSIDDSEVRAALKRGMAATGNLTPVMKAIGERLLRSTNENFSGESAPDGTKWEQSSAAKAEGRKTLTKSSQLRNSIYYKAESDQVRIGSPKPYAAIHQLGGKAGRGLKVKLPARPFIGVSAEDRIEIIEILNDHLRAALKK